MKILIVDNMESNRSLMNQMLHQQTVLDVSGLLEAPNRIMGAMLVEAISFDLVILGGVLENTLPDGTKDLGDGVSLASQLLQKSPLANVVLWSSNIKLQKAFEALLCEHKRVCLPHYCWAKDMSQQELSSNLHQIFNYQFDANKSSRFELAGL